ncbi:MAG: TrkA family potassium uptake protein [Candidatus Krumholzibacteriota bacterium]|nr:TrkA family potassium uptake protein [Candidatus Krumholzibacteriota bacterium]
MAGKYTVIGLGNFGFHVTRTLFEDGQDVMGLDIDEERVMAIRPYSTQAIVGDATQKEMIKTLGLEEMDAVVVGMGGRTEAATLITLYLREIGVKRIIVKATNQDHGKILTAVGATDIIHPEKDIAIKIAKNLSSPDILDFFPMSEDYMIAEIAPVNSFVGKSLAELQLRSKFNINIIGIKELVPENFVLVPAADFVIKHSDILLVTGKRTDIKKLEEMRE